MVWYVQIKRLLSLYIAGRCGGERGAGRIGNFTEPRKQHDLLLWSVCRNPRKNLRCANHHFITDPWRNKVKTERDFQKYQMASPLCLKNCPHPSLFHSTIPHNHHIAKRLSLSDTLPNSKFILHRRLKAWINLTAMLLKAWEARFPNTH